MPKTPRTKPVCTRLSEDNLEWLEKEMAKHHYASRSEFINDLITKLREKGDAAGPAI